MLEETCCFTGHRTIPPEELPHLRRCLEELLPTLIARGVTHFQSGGALGFDTLAAQVVLSLKSRYPEIVLELILPCRGQERLWPREQQDTYRALLQEADTVRYLREHYCRGCMHERNRFMVDHSGHCIAYLTKSTGGTAYTVDYAKKQGRTLHPIP